MLEITFLKFRCIHQNALIPVYPDKRFDPNQEAVGADLRALYETVVPIGRTVKIPTGIAVQVPHNYELQIRPLFSLSAEGIHVPNSPGTIGSDCEAEIVVLILNLSEQLYTVKRGERIAKAVLSPVVRAEWKVVSSFTDQT